ncbi:hypothetical protein VNO77_34036 [Canavalia gladiata]|uniref:O-methyltransferase C-terminal domain-containing protein n=1 Tax=Canavalia gladiata TaxID=3824 RepID=A0AAN9PY83_CANGL
MSTIYTEKEACRSAFLLCMNQVFTAVLNGAIELNLFDIIAMETALVHSCQPLTLLLRCQLNTQSYQCHRLLHNWSDEKCLSLLRNCHKALPQNGKVIVMDFIVPEALDLDVSKIVSMVDNIMLIMLITVVGREQSMNLRLYPSSLDFHDLNLFAIPSLHWES